MIFVCKLTVVLVALVTTGFADVDVIENNEWTNDVIDTDTKATIIPATPNLEDSATMPESLARAMEQFKTTADLAHTMAKDNVLPDEETEKQYIKMAQLAEEILDHMYNPNNAHSFLQAKGLNAVIAPNINIQYSQLRVPLLQLMKALFEIAPRTTVDVIPNFILDKLVDIYEQDEDSEIKKHAIELLSVWLPGNPQAQIRVMKMRGLQPFYKQLTKLDMPITRLTLELFSTILNEHAAARDKARGQVQKSKADYETTKMYQQVGLIERLSTPMLCNGLLRIFEEVFEMPSPDHEMLPPVLKLFDIIKPHCTKIYAGRSKVTKLIDHVLEYIRDPEMRLHLERMGVNVAEAADSLNDFALNIDPRHTEL